MKTAASFLSTKRAIWLLAIAVLAIFLGTRMDRGTQSPRTLPLTPAGPNAVNRINADVVELAWNGAPKGGYVLSDALPMNIGDRIVIYWLGGCFQSRPLRECNQPWGFLDPTAENRHLFRYPRGQFAVHILQGDREDAVWERGENEMTLVVRALPVRLVFNGLAAPGIYYGAGIRLPIDGYTPPNGTLFFRIVNRH